VLYARPWKAQCHFTGAKLRHLELYALSPGAIPTLKFTLGDETWFV